MYLELSLFFFYQQKANVVDSGASNTGEVQFLNVAEQSGCWVFCFEALT